jgi:hypothetical protein
LPANQPYVTADVYMELELGASKDSEGQTEKAQASSGAIKKD